MLAEAEVEVKAREMDEKLKRLKKKVESSSESEEEVRPRRVEPEPVFETVSASRSQIQHELQMMRREMAMRAMVQAPALWINEPLDPARHGNETQVWSLVWGGAVPGHTAANSVKHSSWKHGEGVYPASRGW